jgi:hypothetical protein
VLEFRIPTARTPKSLGINGDPRVLGMCVFELKLETQQ